MKLYSEQTSERASRPAKKGGNKYIAFHLYRGNKWEYSIRYTENGLHIKTPDNITVFRNDQKA